MFKLIINNVEVDVLNTSDIIALTKNGFNPEEPFTKIGDYSTTITLPRTEKNNKVFQWFGLSENTTNANNLPNFKAQIYYNNSLLLDGFFFIDSANLNEIRGNIISTPFNIENEFKNKTLRDINTFKKVYYNPITSADTKINVTENPVYNSVSLDGVNDKIALSGNMLDVFGDGNNNFTIQFWLYFDSTNPINNWNEIFFWGGTSGNRISVTTYYYLSNRVALFLAVQNGFSNRLVVSDFTDPANGIIPNNWYLVTLTYNSTLGSSKYYINNSIDRSIYIEQNGAISFPNANTIREIGGGNSRPITKMKIADFTVYKKALSTTEINESYNTGIGKRLNSLNDFKTTLYLPLNETSGTVANDYSPLKNNATYQNGVLLNQSALAPAPSNSFLEVNKISDVWNTDDYGFQLPLISYGNFSANPNITTLNPINTGVTIPNSGGLVDGGILWNDSINWTFEPLQFKPALYLSTTLENIFGEVGYSVAGDFYNEVKSNKTLIPFVDSNNNDINYNIKNIATAYYSVSGSVSIPNTTSGVTRYWFRNANNERNISASHSLMRSKIFRNLLSEAGEQYIVPKDGKYRFYHYGLHTLSGTSNGTYTIDLYKWQYPMLGITSLMYQTGVTLAASATTEATIDITLDCKKNEVVLFTYKQVANGVTSANTITTSGANVYFFIPLEDSEGNTYSDFQNTAMFAPDVDINEFLKSLIGMFNLNLTIDNNSKVIRFDYDKNYSLQKQINLTNFTSNLDFEASLSEPINIYKFKHSDNEGDMLLTNDYYQFEVVNNSIYSNEKREFESIFIPITKRNYVLPRQNNLELDITTYQNKDELKKKLGELGSGAEQLNYNYPLTLINYEGLVNKGVPSSGLTIGFTNEITNGKPHSEPFVNIPDTTPVNLKWSDLVNNHYNQFFEINKKGVVFTFDVLLTPKLFAEINSNSVIRIDQQLYKLIEISDYNPAEPITKIKLMKL